MDTRSGPRESKPEEGTGALDDSIGNRFRYHKPGEHIEAKHERVREEFKRIAFGMDMLLPLGREAAIVQTKLEEAMFWANAAIARHQ